MAESTQQDNIINKHWCKKQEMLLQKWSEKAAGYRWLHTNARLYFSRRNDYLAYPSIIISSITGVGGFAVLNPNGHEDMGEKTKKFIIAMQYVFAFLNVMGGILSSLSKFSQYSNLTAAHSTMCVQWSKLYRAIDMELSLDTKHRADAIEFVMKIREDYDRLLSESPDIPQSSIIAFHKAFPTRANKPDVCNGLSIIDSVEVTSNSRRPSVKQRWVNVFKSIRQKSFEKE